MNLGLLLPKHFRQEKPTLLPRLTPTLGDLVMTLRQKCIVQCTMYMNRLLQKII